MPTPSSGNPISLNDIQTEFGGTNPIGLNEYYRGGSEVESFQSNNIPTSGTIDLADFYGLTNVTYNIELKDSNNNSLPTDGTFDPNNPDLVEGDTINIVVTTTGVANGTQLYYSLGGTLNDFVAFKTTSGAYGNTGTITINNNTGTDTKVIGKDPRDVGGNGWGIQAYLFTDSARSNQVDSWSGTYVLNEYKVSSSNPYTGPNSVYAGKGLGQIDINMETYTQSGSTLYGEPLHVTANFSNSSGDIDLYSNDLSILGYYGGSHNASVNSLRLPANTFETRLDADSNETFQLDFEYGPSGNNAVIVYTTPYITIKQPSISLIKTSQSGAIIEGLTYNFNFSMGGTSIDPVSYDGETLYWDITHTNTASADFSADSGTITLSGYSYTNQSTYTWSNADFTVSPTRDNLDDANEEFTINVYSTFSIGSTQYRRDLASYTSTLNSGTPSYFISRYADPYNQLSSDTKENLYYPNYEFRFSVYDRDIGENSSVTFYWKIEPVSGTLTSSDFVLSGYSTYDSQNLSGTMIINGNTGSFTSRTKSLYIRHKEDYVREGSESYRVKFYSNSSFTSLLATSSSTSITEQSPSYGISDSLNSGQFGGTNILREGDSISFNFIITYDTVGLTYYYRLVAASGYSIDLNDFTQNGQTPTTFDGSGTTVGSYQYNWFTVTYDATITEAVENDAFRLQLYTDSNYTQLVDTSNTIFIHNKLPTYSVSESTTTLEEGQSVTFTFNVGYESTGTTYYYDIVNTGGGTAITSADIGGTALQGTFTNSGSYTSSTASLQLTFDNDAIADDPAEIRLDVYTDSARTQLASQSSDVTVNVATPTYTIYIDNTTGSSNTILKNEGDTITFRIETTNVPVGQNIYWKISNFYSIDSNDFVIYSVNTVYTASAASSSGDFYNGVTNDITITITDDLKWETNDIDKFFLLAGPTSTLLTNPNRAGSPEVHISDTSVGVIVTNNNGTSFTEAPGVYLQEDVTYTSLTQPPTNSTIYIEVISPSYPLDNTNGHQDGDTFTRTSTSITGPNLQFYFLNSNQYHSPETFQYRLRKDDVTGPIIYTSQAISVSNAAVTANIEVASNEYNSNTSQVDETSSKNGNYPTLSVTATNLDLSQQLSGGYYFTLMNLSLNNDYVYSSTLDRVVMTWNATNNQYEGTTPAINFYTGNESTTTFEGNETFQIQLYTDQARLNSVVTSTNSITIVDNEPLAYFSNLPTGHIYAGDTITGTFNWNPNSSLSQPSGNLTIEAIVTVGGNINGSSFSYPSGQSFTTGGSNSGAIPSIKTLTGYGNQNSPYGEFVVRVTIVSTGETIDSPAIEFRWRTLTISNSSLSRIEGQAQSIQVGTSPILVGYLPNVSITANGGDGQAYFSETATNSSGISLYSRTWKIGRDNSSFTQSELVTYDNGIVSPILNSFGSVTNTPITASITVAGNATTHATGTGLEFTLSSNMNYAELLYYTPTDSTDTAITATSSDFSPVDRQFSANTNNSGDYTVTITLDSNATVGGFYKLKAAFDNYPGMTNHVDLAQSPLIEIVAAPSVISDVTFSNAGRTEFYGPSYDQFNTYYTANMTEYSFVNDFKVGGIDSTGTTAQKSAANGYQSFEIPAGTYDVTINGAAGGRSNSAPSVPTFSPAVNFVGTNGTDHRMAGAQVTFRMVLTTAKTLTMVCGHRGVDDTTTYYNPSGGGGTYLTIGTYAQVQAGTDTLIAAAGGAGGLASQNSSYTMTRTDWDQGNGQSSESGAYGGGGSSSLTQHLGGTSGNGGVGPRSSNNSGSGGGYISGSNSVTTARFGATTGDLYAAGFRQGSVGDEVNNASLGRHGGFGGGGAGSNQGSTDYDKGGGGGYSGGGYSFDVTAVGGGGGSYLATTSALTSHSITITSYGSASGTGTKTTGGSPNIGGGSIRFEKQ